MKALPRRRLLLVAPALLGSAALWLLLPADRAPSQAAAPVYTDWSFNPFAKGQPLEAVQHNHDAQRQADAARAKVQQVLASGSLRGTELDGDWGSWVDGQLQPGAGLRRRFDYLLTAMGEVNPTELRHWIEQELSTERDPAAARQVLAVWDRYLMLQQAAFTAQVKLSDPASWQLALAERVAARRQILGADWAQAFYADEEQAFRDFSDGRPSPAEATPAPAALDTAAAERVRAEEAAWADWERRLQAARDQAQTLAAAPELSAPQRSQALESYLAAHFSGGELVRAKALLGTAP
jgi:lipase chaperone LimK